MGLLRSQKRDSKSGRPEFQSQGTPASCGPEFSYGLHSCTRSFHLRNLIPIMRPGCLAPLFLGWCLLFGSGYSFCAPAAQERESGAVGQSVTSDRTTQYDATWESLDARPVAPWFRDAKFGVYVHWTLAAVPAWGLHSTFYWPDMELSREKEKNGFRAIGNTVDEEYAGVWQFHVKNYGADFKFEQFAPMFRAELFDPDRWADIFVRSGAKYVVLTAKHHDGFALWPDPHSSKAYGRPWNAMEVGPRQDIVQELSTSVRKRGLKMGLYYSLFEWYNPLWLHDKPRYVTEHMLSQLKDMITRYKPDLLWTDGAWLAPDTTWKSLEFLQWLFNDSDDRNVVVDDRWGNNCRHKHGGFYTTEFTPGMSDGRHPWEENRTTVRPMKYDVEGRPLWYEWVVDRRLTLEDYYTPWELILTLVDTVSRGGNLLLNIGPTADGRILAIQEERLLQIGDWLKVNGEAIYGTRPWRTAAKWSLGERPHIEYNQEWRIKYDIREIAGRPVKGKAAVQVFFTSKGDTLYAIVPKWPAGSLVLKGVRLPGSAEVTMLGLIGQLRWRRVKGGVEVIIPPVAADRLPCQYAYVIKLPHGAA